MWSIQGILFMSYVIQVQASTGKPEVFNKKQEKKKYKNHFEWLEKTLT